MAMEKQQLVAQTQQVAEMFDEGVLKQDEHGNYVLVMDPAEKAHLKQQNSLSK